MPGESIMKRGSSSVAACAAVLAATMCGTSNEARAVDQIERYCTVSWRNARIEPQEWRDCTQETFARLLERVSREGLPDAIARRQSHERRELNRCIWSVVQKRRRLRRSAPLEADQIPAPATADPAPSDDTPLSELLDRAASSLSPIQREVLRRWAEGDSIAHIATGLGTTSARVSDHKYKALARLRTEWSEAGGFENTDSVPQSPALA